MSKTGQWVIAEQERAEMYGLPDPLDGIDADWESELADMLAREDPERIEGHDYATDMETRSHWLEETITPAEHWENN